MIQYSIELGEQIFIKGYRFLSFARNICAEILVKI